MAKLTPFLFVSLLLLPIPTRGDCTCDADDKDSTSSREISLKLIAIFSILAAGSAGVCLPSLGKWIPALHPDKDLFFVLKAFAAGVILSTGFVHILPDASENLTSPCLPPSPWQDFPFAGFAAMVGAIATLVVDTVATGYFARAHGQSEGHVADAEKAGVDDVNRHVQVQVHVHATHGHAHGPVTGTSLTRHRVVSQVLELGILVHSVIIGISLGVSESSSSIRPLVVALCFHQFFEGIGLGGCLVQARFKLRTTATMVLFFSLTTPMGIAVGIGVSSGYDENSPTALVVEGVLNACAAGILVYMALVDLLAADFMDPRVQENGRLQIMVNG
ncbi:hypothetical protein HPP92_019710 [Vanilla planifolia]|uniref:Uncharacterized protein n=1 Tax=Vanilla planifolia TaxID=51239 RepID=A0A835PZW8_VANPL|nr:hypothetical protein HPP92_019710 [Vanilla planifolia]